MRRDVPCLPEQPVSLAHRADTVATLHLAAASVTLGRLAAHPRVQMLWLPKYGAHEVNPVERIWGLPKTDVAGNRLAGTLAILVAAAHRFFHELPLYPVALPVAHPALAAAA